ncbi:hypothetical protein RJ639_026945 [Escallonia herrerae]|uniref:O-fucosyltransferase family protein n=1 Tax=Escallonia herrerae TaxID=1293975 RepID=A0AA88X8Z3_9ASTE|nr:hypothetical protein RJ639_026945 [Escallonia herrerae]
MDSLCLVTQTFEKRCMSGFSHVRVFCIVHEICMDGTASELSTSGNPCLKRDSAPLSTCSFCQGPGVAFHALRFAAPIRELGYQIARRMWIEGQYVAIHLRLEKDVWLRTGCLSGLGPEYDNIITQNRESHPQFLTGRSNMSYVRRRLAGLCPLNAFEVARLLKGLGAPGNAQVYITGGDPFGSAVALQPLTAEFLIVLTKEMLARENKLAPYINRSSIIAAIEYTVSLSSDVFLPSHGGKMGCAMKACTISEITCLRGTAPPEDHFCCGKKF